MDEELEAKEAERRECEQLLSQTERERKAHDDGWMSDGDYQATAKLRDELYGRIAKIDGNGKKVSDSIPERMTTIEDATAELGQTAAEGAEDSTTNGDAIAELAELVAGIDKRLAAFEGKEQ